MEQVVYRGCTIRLQTERQAGGGFRARVVIQVRSPFPVRTHTVLPPDSWETEGEAEVGAIDAAARLIDSGLVR